MSTGFELRRVVERASSNSDLLLAALVVGIIGLMVLPLPTVLLDVLIAANLSISVTLLMISMYIKGALSFSTFPSLLLITTLFRLSLNVASARLILLEAYAGEVILTFGKFVVGGNLVVGAVIFLIITIVQFLVIAKGAERVAEVAARFTLDAMPGKQMSIDADMRAGVIDLDQARRRRSELEQESQLFGAMDGAMKFVKGDSIAGLIITATCIVAGLTVGVLQKGMPLDKALKTYSILTIGDGLVSQIPALLICITSGIIVTRVSSDDAPPLGISIGQQVLAQPKAILIGSGLLFAAALVPGFPKIPFFALGLVLGLVGFTLLPAGRSRTTSRRQSPSQASATAGGTDHASEAVGPAGQAAEDFSLTAPLLIDAAEALEGSLDRDRLDAEIADVRRALYHDLGVQFPAAHLRFHAGLASNQYRILLQEVPVAEGRLRPGQVLARESEENLQVLGFEYAREEPFLPGLPALWVDESRRNQVMQAGIPVLDIHRIIGHHLAVVLKRYAGEFLGLQETKQLLNSMEERFPELVKEVQRVMPVPKINEILQRLVQEEVSIRNLRLILQALIEWGQKEKDTVLLVEHVRSSLKRYLSYKYSGGQNLLAVYLLHPDLEDTMRKAIRQTASGSYLALEPATVKRFIAALKKQVGNLSQARQKPVLLASMDVRRFVRKLIEAEMPDLPVLSYQDLTEEITLQPLAKITV
jgi:type III secretion protein V